MASSGLYNFRFSIRRIPPRERNSISPALEVDAFEAAEVDGIDTATFELLSSLRGAQPDRIRSLFTSQPREQHHLPLRLAFAELPSKFRRR